MTSYSNFLGTGDRRAYITVTAREGLFDKTYRDNAAVGTAFVDSDIDVLINGVNGDTLGIKSGITDGWVKFNFHHGASATLTHPRVIDAFTFWLFGASSLGTWRWYGSSDDNTYFALGASFNLQGASPPGPSGAGVEIVQPAGNDTGFLYYMLVQESGATINYKLREFDFRIEQGELPSESEFSEPTDFTSESELPDSALVVAVAGQNGGTHADIFARRLFDRRNRMVERHHADQQQHFRRPLVGRVLFAGTRLVCCGCADCRREPPGRHIDRWQHLDSALGGRKYKLAFGVLVGGAWHLCRGRRRGH
jgi:hypothetical protein